MIGAAVSDFTTEDLRRFERTVAGRCRTDMNRFDREDVAGDMLVDAWSAAKRAQAPLLAFAIATSRRPRYYTRSAARLTSTVALPGPTGEPERGSSIGDVASADDFIVSIETHDLLSCLPIRQRRVVVLCLVLGMTHDEAASAIGVTAATIREHLRRARETLQSMWLRAEAA